MGKTQFRKHILASLLFQIVFISLLMIALSMAGKSGMGLKGQLIVSLVGIATFFISSKFTYKPQMILARFEEIYPDKNLPRHFVTFTIFFPIYYLTMILILCFKDRSEINETPWFFTYRCALPAVVVLLVLQCFMTPVAYLTAVPSFYFIKKTTDNSLNIFEAKESLGRNSSVLDDYKKRFNSTLSSTEIILLSAQTLGNIVDEKRSTASEGEDKKVVKFKRAITVINQMTEFLNESESFKLRLSDYSPLHWIHPGAPAEMLLISSVEFAILQRFKRTVHGQMNTIISDLENNAGSMSEKEQESLKQQLSEAKVKFRKISDS